MARRGFFAELQHQHRAAVQAQERNKADAYRRHVSAIKKAEQAKREWERANINLSKAAESERKQLEKNAREAHLAAKEADVVERNEKLEQTYEEIDSLLASTLAVDDYIDLNSLREVVMHPPFDRADLEVPKAHPTRIVNPDEPILVLPIAPTGLASFFGKKKYVEDVQIAQQSHERALADMRTRFANQKEIYRKAQNAHAQEEALRLEALRSARERYLKQCAARESRAAERNQKLDELITNVGYGTADAIQEYVSIVLSNSVYPDHFQAAHEFEFDPSTAELRLCVLVPSPSDVSTVKSYKYAKATDEITSTSLSQKECKDRYAGAIHQIALRSFHEVFESDRRGLIKTISLEVGTNAVDPATGQQLYVPFVIAAAEREFFLTFKLSAVVPALTLGKLAAAVSKNPFSLIAVERAGGRRS